ncbi:hypothetical protein PR048_033561 [Dryococelus australis]|uniref:Uncharacterized protein n=1 Tax=Dryococelus australis TaxID=614101 RepID=A0ABQ9G3P5_9NEOP|nr:hypothetical protein PR048_033561 [Dryococelus australis]
MPHRAGWHVPMRREGYGLFFRFCILEYSASSQLPPPFFTSGIPSRRVARLADLSPLVLLQGKICDQKSRKCDYRNFGEFYQFGSPLVDDRPIINGVKYRVVSGVVWTNRAMVSSNTDTNRTGVLAVVDIETMWQPCSHGWPGERPQTASPFVCSHAVLVAPPLMISPPPPPGTPGSPGPIIKMAPRYRPAHVRDHVPATNLSYARLRRHLPRAEIERSQLRTRIQSDLGSNFEPRWCNRALGHVPIRRESTLSLTLDVTESPLCCPNSEEGTQAAREMASGREVCNCEYRAVKSAAGRLDYWTGCIPEKTRRLAASSGTIPTCENPGLNPVTHLMGGEQANRSATKDRWKDDGSWRRGGEGEWKLDVVDQASRDPFDNEVLAADESGIKREWSSAGIPGTGETGDRLENPPTSGIVRRDSHSRESRSYRVRDRTRFAMAGGEGLGAFVFVGGAIRPLGAMEDRPKGYLAVCGPDGVWSRGGFVGIPVPGLFRLGRRNGGRPKGFPVGELSRKALERDTENSQRAFVSAALEINGEEKETSLSRRSRGVEDGPCVNGTRTRSHSSDFLQHRLQAGSYGQRAGEIRGVVEGGDGRIPAA